MFINQIHYSFNSDAPAFTSRLFLDNDMRGRKKRAYFNNLYNAAVPVKISCLLDGDGWVKVYRSGGQFQPNL